MYADPVKTDPKGIENMLVFQKAENFVENK